MELQNVQNTGKLKMHSPNEKAHKVIQRGKKKLFLYNINFSNSKNIKPL